MTAVPSAASAARTRPRCPGHRRSLITARSVGCGRGWPGERHRPMGPPARFLEDATVAGVSKTLRPGASCRSCAGGLSQPCADPGHGRRVRLGGRRGRHQPGRGRWHGHRRPPRPRRTAKAKARRSRTPCHSQCIAHRGACGKTRVVPQNGWPRPEPTEPGVAKCVCCCRRWARGGTSNQWRDLRCSRGHPARRRGVRAADCAEQLAEMQPAEWGFS